MFEIVKIIGLYHMRLMFKEETVWLSYHILHTFNASQKCGVGNKQSHTKVHQQVSPVTVYFSEITVFILLFFFTLTIYLSIYLIN